MSDAALFREVFLMLITLFVSLFHLKELSTCIVPMHWWVIIEWLFLIFLAISIFSQGFRFALGSILIIVASVLFAIWNLVGTVMVILSWIYTPTCIPSFIQRGLVSLVILMSTCTVYFFFVLCSAGISSFNVYFHNVRRDADWLNRVERGEVRAEQAIRNNSGVDTYKLSNDETVSLVQHCTSKYDSARQAQYRDTTCSICMSDFLNNETILTFPTCHHIFHSPCILEWLNTRSNCPMCRQGIRSGLYREIEARNTAAPLVATGGAYQPGQAELQRLV